MSPLATMFVLVPIRVQQPPKIDAYEIGINSFDDATPKARESAMATGKEYHDWRVINKSGKTGDSCKKKK